MSLYIFNNRQEVIKIVPYKRLLSVVQEQEINSKDELNIEIPNTDWLTLDEQPFYLAVRDVYKRYSFHMYKVIKDVTGTHTSQITGIQLGFDELKAHGYIKDRRFNGSDIRVAGEAIVDGTDWELGYVSSDLPLVNTNFYYITRLEALSKLLEVTGAEFQFRVEITGNKITAKRLDLYKQLSEDKGKRFVHGDKLLGITKESDNASLITALVGRGKGEETETGGYGRRLTFEDVEWSTDKPVVKPLGQEYVEIPEMTALYGYPDGSPRFGIAEFGDTEDAEGLLEQTYASLVDLARPQVQFKASVHSVGDMELGETVTIIRDEIGIRYKTRVFKVSRNLLNNNRTSVELGDKIGQSIGKTINKINTAIKDQREEVIEIVQVSANGKNKIYRGVTEPTKGMMVGDLWYKPVNDGEVEMYQWNGRIWELIVSSAVNKEIEKRLEEAKVEVDEARDTAEKAVKEIDDAVNGAGFTSLNDTIKNARDLALQAQEDARDIIDNKGDVLGLTLIEQAIADIENPSSETWKNIMESDSGHIVEYTKENNESVLNSASTQTASQITTALSDYTSGDLDDNVSTLLNSVSSQTARSIDTKLTSYVTGDTLDGKVEEVLTNVTQQTAEMVESKLTSYTTNEQLGEVKTSVNEVIRTADSTKMSLVDVINAMGMTGSTESGVQPISRRFMEIEYNVRGIQSTVGDETKGLVSQYNQLAEGFRTTVADVNGLNTVVGQLSDSWVVGIKNGEDLVTAINATRDGVYLGGDKIILDGDTTIDGSFTVTDTIFAKNMSIDKFTTGTLNAANVNLINVNVDSLVGNTSNFVKSSWNNAVGGGVEVTGNGLVTKGSSGSEIRVRSGDIQFYAENSPNNLVGLLYTAYEVGTGTLVGVSVGLRDKNRFSITRYNGENYTVKFLLNGDDELVSSVPFYMRGKTYIQNGAELYGGIEVNSNINIQSGAIMHKKGSIFTSAAEDFVITTPTTLKLTGVTGVQVSGEVEFMNKIRPYMMDFKYDKAGQTGKMFATTAGGLSIQTDGDLGLSGDEVVMFTNLNMNSNTIINQSDIRLKKDIKPAKVNAITEIKKMSFIDYKWDRDLKPEAPEEEQFGIVAQYAPFLQAKSSGSESYLSIDLNKQVNLNSKAIQEIIKMLEEKLGGM